MIMMRDQTKFGLNVLPFPLAVADDMYGYATTSWYLAEAVSHIELNTDQMTEEEVAKVEEVANQKIREATPVSIREFEASDPELKKVRVRCVFM